MLIPLRDSDAATCGSKAATLGRLIRAGFPVPGGVVIPFEAAESVVADDSLLLAVAAEALARSAGGVVAVRSSASGEDTDLASAAGQHESVLGVETAAHVAEAIAAVCASASSERAATYRRLRGAAPLHAAPTRMAVIIQEQLHPTEAGVMFVPADPAAPTLIEAAAGTGPDVVGGRVTPRTCRVSDPEPGSLAALGREIATTLGGGQDVEWALADGRYWVLQARPITADLPSTVAGPIVGTPFSAGAPLAGATLSGSPGSSGVVTGTARVVRGPGDFGRVRPGDVIVCPFTDPAWTPLLAVARGVVTRTGGILSHAAIVAREHGIPAVIGVTEALERIADGVLVTVDGDAGIVTLEGGAA